MRNITKDNNKSEIENNFFITFIFILFNKFIPITTPNNDERSNKTIKSHSNGNSKMAISKKIANNVFNIIINNALDAACLMFILANKINAGTIMKPPPIPNSPVSNPINIPIINNSILALYCVSKFGLLNSESPEKKMMKEKKINNKLSLEISNILI